MAKPWHVPPGLWTGKTVAVLASGPRLTRELADAVRHLPRVCARWAIKLAPDADVCIAIDDYPNEGFWDYALANFPGIKLTGAYQSKLPDEVGYFWHRYEFVKLTPTNEISFRNNGISAIRIAEQSGAAKILLLGFEPERSGRFYDDVTSFPGQVGEWYPGLTQGITNLITKLRAKGIEVVRIHTLADLREHVPAPVVLGTVTGDFTGESLPPLSNNSYAPDAAPLDQAPEQRFGWNRKRKP